MRKKYYEYEKCSCMRKVFLYDKIKLTNAD